MAKQENNKCQNCVFYKLCIQPDYIMMDGQTKHICSEYEEGIPQEIWEEKQECEEFFEDIEGIENAN